MSCSVLCTRVNHCGIAEFFVRLAARRLLARLHRLAGNIEREAEAALNCNAHRPRLHLHIIPHGDRIKTLSADPPTGMYVYDPPPMKTPVREGETIEGSRTMRNRPYPVLKCSSAQELHTLKKEGSPSFEVVSRDVRTATARTRFRRRCGVRCPCWQPARTPFRGPPLRRRSLSSATGWTGVDRPGRLRPDKRRPQSPPLEPTPLRQVRRLHWPRRQVVATRLTGGD